MRIQRLDLLAFGPFTGVSLALDGGRYGLHLVLGPNEAGKSSTLRALRQWLYGIPHNSLDNFVHPYQKLRIGGVLVNDAGQCLEFIRRKGRTNTLRGPDDAGLVEQSQLDAMLGGMDETAFAQRFGIDYAELRKGGAAIVQGSGELGEMLFAAGAGIADVRHVQMQLEAEMQELFKPSGSNPRINDALKRLKQAHDEIKTAQLPTSEWMRVDKRLRDDDARQQELDVQLRNKRQRESHLKRIVQALPKIGRRKQLLDQLAEVADAPQLPDDFAQQRSQTTAQLDHARQDEQTALKQIERLRRDIAAQTIPAGLLEHRSAITRLHAKLGSYQKASEDRPSLMAQLESAQQQARAILRDLGREPDLDRADQFRLTQVQRHRIQALAAECRALVEKQRLAQHNFARLENQHQRLERELAELPAASDVTQLRQAIRRAQRHGDLDQQLADVHGQLQQLEHRAEIDLKKLRLFQGTLEQLQTLPVPLPETIDRFENELADAQRAVQRSDEQLAEWTGQRETTDRELEKLRLEHDVPTEEDLVQARQRRDEGWQLVRETLRDGQPADADAAEAFVAVMAAGGDLAAAFQASQDAADTVADRLRREASQVEKKAMLTVQQQELERRILQQQASRESAETARNQLQAQWRDLWSELGMVPQSPREMRAWLAQQKALVQLADAIRQQRVALQQGSQTIQSLRDQLSQHLRQHDRPLATSSITLADLLETSEDAAASIEASNQQRQKLAEQIQQVRDQLVEAQQLASQADRDLEGWRTDWAQAVATLGLDRDAAPEEANRVLDAVETMWSLLKDAEKLRERIQGIDTDAEAFGEEVRELLASVAPQMLGRPVDQAIADLHHRLEEASRDKTKRDEWERQLRDEEAKRDQAHADVEQLEAQLRRLCQLAGCASPEEMPEAEQRWDRRRHCQRELQMVEEQLAELAAGAPLEQFIAEVEPLDPDALHADLLRLADDIEQLDREKTEVAQQIGSSRNELRRMDGGGDAAEANERAEQLLAQLRTDVEQYVRLRLASSVLRRAIDRFRESSQGPVLERASELFAAFTLSSFAGLRPDYDDKGQAVLVGIRPGSGQAVSVAGMSDGTCDQLYLALRLALLETHLDGREPLPLIVDDILIMFDDARAAAALQALADLSQKTQVIFFTHHEHLVRLAQATIAEDTLFLHTLASG